MLCCAACAVAENEYLMCCAMAMWTAWIVLLLLLLFYGSAILCDLFGLKTLERFCSIIFFYWIDSIAHFLKVFYKKHCFKSIEQYSLFWNSFSRLLSSNTEKFLNSSLEMTIFFKRKFTKKTLYLNSFPYNFFFFLQNSIKNNISGFDFKKKKLWFLGLLRRFFFFFF